MTYIYSLHCTYITNSHNYNQCKRTAERKLSKRASIFSRLLCNKTKTPWAFIHMNFFFIDTCSLYFQPHFLTNIQVKCRPSMDQNYGSSKLGSWSSLAVQGTQRDLWVSSTDGNCLTCSQLAIWQTNGGQNNSSHNTMTFEFKPGVHHLEST